MSEEVGTVSVQDLVDEGVTKLDPIGPAPKSRVLVLGNKEVAITPVKVENWGNFTNALSSLAKLFEKKRGEMFAGEGGFSASILLDSLGDCGKDVVSILAGMTGIPNEDIKEAGLADLLEIIDAWLEVNDADRVAKRFFALSGRIKGAREAFQKMSEKIATSAS